MFNFNQAYLYSFVPLMRFERIFPPGQDGCKYASLICLTSSVHCKLYLQLREAETGISIHSTVS